MCCSFVSGVAPAPRSLAVAGASSSIAKVQNIQTHVSTARFLESFAILQEASHCLMSALTCVGHRFSFHHSTSLKSSCCRAHDQQNFKVTEL